jgi:hypothetical protein
MSVIGFKSVVGLHGVLTVTMGVPDSGMSRPVFR